MRFFYPTPYHVSTRFFQSARIDELMEAMDLPDRVEAQEPTDCQNDVASRDRQSPPRDLVLASG